MNNKIVIGTVMGLVIGFGITEVYMRNNNTASRATPAPGHMLTEEMKVGNTDSDQLKGTMAEMTAGLQEKHGDDFDKAFIVGMIEHHQGAINMANVALKNANHQEIKILANDIIAAQTKEIAQMKQWKKAWFGK